MLVFRNVFSLILAASLFQVAVGLLGVIVPISLVEAGYSKSVIGIIAGVYSAGFMAGAFYAPRLITDIGNIRTFSTAAGLSAVAILIMALYSDPYVWAVMRFVQGISIALMFASDESWMTEATPSEQRGTVIGIYHVAAKLALIIGPFFAVGQTSSDVQPFIWCAIFLIIALVPVGITRSIQPDPPDPDPFPISAMYRIAPAAVIGAFIAGFSNTGFLALLPIYADNTKGDVGAAAAQIMAATWIGGMLTQFPAGYISDRIDRRIVIAIMGILSAIASALLFVINGMPSSLLVLAMLGLWGGGALSFYGLCVAHAADRCAPKLIARMLSGLLFVWAAGSILGPVVFGFVMETEFGARGLFLLELVIGIALAILMLWRRTARSPVKEENRETYEAVLPTSVNNAELDPRSEDIASKE